MGYVHGRKAILKASVFDSLQLGKTAWQGFDAIFLSFIMGRAEEIFERLKSDGVSAIDEFILNRQSEELFLDCKRSADHGRGPRTLHATDRDNLAKAISGFGNSEGGVIIWGVDASVDMDYADVARAKVLIENVARFKSWLVRRQRLWPYGACPLWGSAPRNRDRVRRWLRGNLDTQERAGSSSIDF